MATPQEIGIDLYKLLPPIYEKYDESLDGQLRRFLAPLQAKLNEIYQDQQRVAELQDPDECVDSFVQWIARSLGWDFISKDEAGQRLEVREIANMYDLKGTVYAMRLLSALSFGPYFKRLYEFYKGGDGTISTIREDYQAWNPWLRYLVEGLGAFADTTWRDAMIARRGHPYAFDATKRFYEYVVYNFISPRIYKYGDLRPRIQAFLRGYRKFHPAGRYCYLMFMMPIADDAESLMADYMLDELSGMLHFDSHWRFDEGVRFDEGPGPVHPSLSYTKVVQYRRFDEGTKEVIGVGDGEETEFAGTMVYFPVNPHGVYIHATVGGKVITAHDNGAGAITDSDGTVTGTINYATREWSLTYTTPPDPDKNIVAEFTRRFDTGWHFDETYSLAAAVIELD